MPIPTNEEFAKMYEATGAKPTRMMFGIAKEGGHYVQGRGSNSFRACGVGVALLDQLASTNGMVADIAEQWGITTEDVWQFIRGFDGAWPSTTGSVEAHRRGEQVASYLKLS